MSRIVMGVDISTNTGISVVRYENGKVDPLETLTWSFKKEPIPILRARKYADEMCALLDKYQPDLIIVEGYATGAHGMSTQIIEVSAMIKFAMSAKGYNWIEIPPTTLKVFAYNKGTGSKSLMIKEVYKRWGFDVLDDNQADAIALCMMGCNLLGMDNVPEGHLRAWDKIRDHYDYRLVLEGLVV
ncbi:crossover junction endodeoxyribonuclease [Vibrio phage vB_VpS_PG28]|nr:crossover junction endodeoxyribonuclease [Vibrio phage vB_VpS_PG28]